MDEGQQRKQTQKVDPKELLGLVALTAGRERLRPTCEMPKLELATLLSDPSNGRATPTPIGVITEETRMFERPPTSTSAREEQLAKGSSGITAIPKALLDIAHELDTQQAQTMKLQMPKAPTKKPTQQIAAIKGSFTAATDASPRRSQPFASGLASAASRRASERVILLLAMSGAMIGVGLAWLSFGS